MHGRVGVVPAVAVAVLLLAVPAVAEPLEWERTDGPKGGYSRYIVQDPTDEDVLYVAFGPSGVWKSTDGGESWEQRNDGLPTADAVPGVVLEHVTALALAESKPQVLYAGTSTGSIYRTSDGASTWEHVFRTPDDPGTGSPGRVQHVSVSPHDCALVFAGTVGGSFYVSRDGGQSWDRVEDGLEIRGSATGTVAFDPTDEQVLYYAPSFFDIESEGRASGLFTSTDAGRTWRKIGGGLETGVVNSVAIDPADPSHLFVAAGSSFAWGFDTHGVYESHDAGETFRKVGTDFEPFTHAIPYVAFSRDGGRVIVGNHPGLDGDLFVSDDGGQTWETKTGLWGDFVAGVAGFDDPDRLLATLYWSGLFLSEDGGETWRDVRGFATSHLHAVYAPGFDADRVYAAAHSNGLFYSDDRGATWTRVKEGDGGVVHESIIHNYESSASRFSPPLLWIRGEFSDEIVVLRDVAEPAWGSIPIPGRPSAVLAHPNEPRRAFVGSDRGLFLATYDDLALRPVEGLDPVAVNELAGDESTVVVGTDDGVYVSRDGGRGWQQAGLAGERVTAAAVAEPGIYAAVEGDGVYLATDGTFAKQNDLTGVTQIVADPGDGETVYFSTVDENGFSAIYSSHDRGATVVREAANLPTMPTPEPHKLSFSADGTTLYLATVDLGVWKAHVRDEPLDVPEPVVDPGLSVQLSTAPTETADGESGDAADAGDTPVGPVSTPGFGAGLAALALVLSVGLGIARRRR